MKTIVKIVFIMMISIIISGCVNKNEKVILTYEDLIVYDGLTLEELSNKIEKNLNSTISGYGYVFAKKSTELGLDPYLAVAIMLHETGCKWTCSSLMQKCNNVGGMKGSPGCNGGSYKQFNSLEEGIDDFLTMLYSRYYAKGYTTSEQIGPIYAEDPNWATKVNKYINEIKNS